MSTLLSIQDVAARTGLTVSTIYTYKWRGILPPPVRTVGNSPLYAPGDIRLFLSTHEGRPNRRDSVRLAKKRRKRRRT
jgi:DNA-binding transcriptional MerR regulator